jgi:hypothetical protein
MQAVSSFHSRDCGKKVPSLLSAHLLAISVQGICTVSTGHMNSQYRAYEQSVQGICTVSTGHMNSQYRAYAQSVQGIWTVSTGHMNSQYRAYEQSVQGIWTVKLVVIIKHVAEPLYTFVYSPSFCYYKEGKCYWISSKRDWNFMLNQTQKHVYSTLSSLHKMTDSGSEVLYGVCVDDEYTSEFSDLWKSIKHTVIRVS